MLTFFRSEAARLWLTRLVGPGGGARKRGQVLESKYGRLASRNRSFRLVSLLLFFALPRPERKARRNQRLRRSRGGRRAPQALAIGVFAICAKRNDDQLIENKQSGEMPPFRIAMISAAYGQDAKRFISPGETGAFRFRWFSASSIRRTAYHSTGLRGAKFPVGGRDRRSAPGKGAARLKCLRTIRSRDPPRSRRGRARSS